MPLAAMLAVAAMAGATPQTADQSTRPEEEAGLQVAEAAAPEDAAAGEGEILVTARRRTERLQETPVSVTAFSGEELEKRGITTRAEIARRVPSLNFGEFGDLKLSPTSLRGVVSGSGSAGADPAIGYYVDDVYVGQGVGAATDLYDVERVEVLRGPQGTLFGRNTIGGVISIATRAPSEQLETSASAGFGNYDRTRLAGSVSGPLAGDTILARLSLQRDRRDGYERNLFLDRRVNDHDSWSARAQLLFNLAAGASLRLTALRTEFDQETLVFETLRYNPDAILPQLLLASGFALNEDPFDRDVIASEPSEERLRATQLSARLAFGLGGVEITNIASWQHHDYYSRTDTCRCQLRFTFDGDPERVERFSNELRAGGEAGRLTWLAGLYWFRQDSRNQSFIELGPDIAALFGDPSIAGLVIGSDARLITNSRAAYASLEIPLAARLDLTLGGRYTHESKAIDYVQTDPLLILGGPVDLEARDDWDRITPSAILRFRPTGELMLYASATNGFKSGGFNDALGDADGISFGPETLWNYEAGIRSAWLRRRLTVNASVFWMDWDDIQVTVQNPETTFFDPIILNAGGAYSRGIEIEAAARPTRRLRFGLNGSVQRVRYTSGALPTGQPLRFVPFAPSYTGSADAEYRLRIAGHEVSLSGEYLLRGRTWLTTNNDPDGRVGGYGLLNLRIAVAGVEQGWRLSAYVNNAADATYRTRLFDLFDNPFNGQKFVTLGPPRTYGVDFRLAF